MKLFKRNKNDDDIHHSSTYPGGDFDDDDESIPPPPPPLPPTDSTVGDHVSVVSSVKTANEEFIDAPRGKSYSNKERAPMVPYPDENNGVSTSSLSDKGSKRGGYSHVPMTGHFRGMKMAQSFDEEEAGMDEIEVPSSSVVDRLNMWEKKYALRKKWRMIALVGVVALVGVLAISLGTAFGTGGGPSKKASLLLDTPAGRVVLQNPSLPDSTKKDLQTGNQGSAAFKALQWIQTADVNKKYNFADATTMENQDVQQNMLQRFTLASVAYSFNQDIPGWMSEADVCDWDGVGCDGARRRELQGGDNVGGSKVTSVSLAEMNLKGPIPPELAMLVDLEQLVMFGNLLSGDIPDEIFSLSNLQILDLYDNDLSGSISAKIENLENLVGLYIGKNGFTGLVPPELFNLVNLIDLWLDNISFDKQPLPHEIGQLVNLQQLKISLSNFNNELPAEIGSLVNLVELTAERNIFEGPIPDLEQLVNLEILDLSKNWFSGDLPKLRDSTQLQYLKLNGNLLSGRIPNHYGNLVNLIELRLGPNTFDGFPDAGITEVIPDSLGNLVNLEILDLQGNNISGAIPDSLSNLVRLERFLVQGNDITGAVPNGMCQLDPSEMEADCDVQCACCTDACSRN